MSSEESCPLCSPRFLADPRGHLSSFEQRVLQRPEGASASPVLVPLLPNQMESNGKQMYAMESQKTDTLDFCRKKQNKTKQTTVASQLAMRQEETLKSVSLSWGLSKVL